MTNGIHQRNRDDGSLVRGNTTGRSLGCVRPLLLPDGRRSIKSNEPFDWFEPEMGDLRWILLQPAVEFVRQLPPRMVVSPELDQGARGMKKLIFAAALTLAATAAQAQGTNQNGKNSATNGGAHVQPHQQTNSNGTQRDNSGATNTGGVGTRTPRN